MPSSFSKYHSKSKSKSKPVVDIQGYLENHSSSRGYLVKYNELKKSIERRLSSWVKNGL
jgi:hypothetical protein